MLNRLRRGLARWIAPRSVRSYGAAMGGRLTSSWLAPQSSADTELANGLQKLRGRSRELIRNASYAKRARTIVVNNVVGSGIGIQAQVKNRRGRLLEDVNSGIETAWAEWCRATSCHTGGTLHFADLERAAMSEVFTAGEVVIRKHYRAFGDSKVPLALELIEAERMADEFTRPAAQGGADVRMGVEMDSFGRPVAYWIRERHPGDIRSSAYASDRLVRVPASEIIHLRIVDRWPSTRGEPWMHAVASRLNDLNGYADAEIVAARGAASYMAFIKTPDPEGAPVGEQQGDQRVVDFQPGIIEKLGPGEDIVINNPNRPNPNMDPFMRLMLREIAAGTGISYESLSRDYSQSNYSSSRLSLIDDRDTWRVLQQWFIRGFREPLHREWLNLAVLARAIDGVDVSAYLADQAKFEAVRFKPRGWSWVDPTKEVEAYKTAVRCGFITVSDVIAQTGNGADIEDVLEARRRELELAEQMDLHFDTDVAEAMSPPAVPTAAPIAEETDDGEEEPEPEDQAPPARIVSLR